MTKYLVLALVFVAAPAIAQDVPAIERTASVAAVMPTMEESARIQLTKREEAALAIAREWRNNPDKPRRSADGTVMYLFGATLPTLVCTPLQVCSIRLQPGEVVNDLHAGDSERWRITPSIIGSGPMAITNIIVKPTDSGLTTNLIVTTDRRSYVIMLKSARHDWMPAIAFDYPDDQQRTWAEYRASQSRATNAATLPTGENTAALDFNFKMDGDSPKWKPQRIYTDGKQTFIQFPSAHFVDEAPILMTIGKGESLWSGPTKKVVNYRLIGDRFVVDQKLDKAALISGVGREEVKVTIEYTGVQ